MILNSDLNLDTFNFPEHDLKLTIPLKTFEIVS